MNKIELEAEIKQIFNGNINAGTTGLLMRLAERYAQSQLLQQTPCTTQLPEVDCGIHNTDFNGKCFRCGKQVFVR